ncbi:molybdenum cofactor sulfurase [Thiohalorhabdus denitrificans]|uniref:MOSC domain-containing protein YiiM n=1 Tax=Thiohalorhabdus denitrificans TaxID=381306 RepID=A0A0P9CE98_9GAMM|nr:MOSC domain-containing protein [Thiohalorhabdus denitrificans]KPV41198.1 molybdenum cofactor sulfurase [Thiohalorhabdus denitrificans]SCY63275.1 MOSC domain-containing protein YiiM [Thiohalorhabdus denitrificans]
MRSRLKALLMGTVQPLTERGPASGIHKTPVARSLWLGEEGLEGDAQGNRRHHGGPDKALHHYPWEHYAHWRGLPHPPEILGAPGAFGENLSTEGLTEAEVCLGDILSLGEAVLQVSQLRQPCATLNVRFGIPDMARRVQESGRVGWYYRVLKPGSVSPDSCLVLLQRPRPEWPLSRVAHLLFHDPGDLAGIEGLLAVSELAAVQRGLLQKRLATGRVEDWSGRLGEPTPNT